MADFTYVSWNVKQFSTRIGLTPNERSTSWSSINPNNNTRVAQMMSEIIEDDLGADVIGVMEGVQNVVEVEDAALEILAVLGANWTYEVSELSVTATKSMRGVDKKIFLRSDRYVMFWRQDPGSRATVAKLSLADSDYTPSGKKRKRDFEDRVPLRFEVTCGTKRAVVFLWHAPQPANTKGAVTVDRLTQWILDTAVIKNEKAILASGDFNINTGQAKKFASLKDKIALDGIFNGMLTTLGQATDSRFKSFGQDSVKAFLSQPYDNIFITGMTCDSFTLLNLGEWATTRLKAQNGVKLTVTTRGLFNDAVRLGNIISDHCPIGVSVTIT